MKKGRNFYQMIVQKMCERIEHASAIAAVEVCLWGKLWKCLGLLDGENLEKLLRETKEWMPPTVIWQEWIQLQDSARIAVSILNECRDEVVENLLSDEDNEAIKRPDIDDLRDFKVTFGEYDDKDKQIIFAADTAANYALLLHLRHKLPGEGDVLHCCASPIDDMSFKTEWGEMISNPKWITIAAKIGSGQRSLALAGLQTCIKRQNIVIWRVFNTPEIKKLIST